LLSQSGFDLRIHPILLFDEAEIGDERLVMSGCIHASWRLWGQWWSFTRWLNMALRASFCCGGSNEMFTAMGLLRSLVDEDEISSSSVKDGGRKTQLDLREIIVDEITHWKG
jgi:hypothetical protein